MSLDSGESAMDVDTPTPHKNLNISVTKHLPEESNVPEYVYFVMEAGRGFKGIL